MRVLINCLFGEHVMFLVLMATVVVLQPASEGEGNVHTGATPPWLQQDSTTDRQEIGPTLHDFHKHCRLACWPALGDICGVASYISNDEQFQ